MKTLTLAFALLACAAFGIPEYSGAPRSPRIWTAGDPMGFSVLKYLADDSAADDTALAARPTFVQSTNIAAYAVSSYQPLVGLFVSGTNLYFVDANYVTNTVTITPVEAP